MARVLIVDNASFMRASLKYIIESAGHEVVGLARDGAEAVEMFTRLKPDLVTLDILMEKMDGLAALKEIRRLYPEARVLMVTALGQEQTVEECRQLGAAGYLRKPFKPEQIVRDINHALEPTHAQENAGSGGG